MNKKIIFLSAVLFSTVMSAQVKIGGTDGTPNTNAMLDVEAPNKGILLPRLALQEAADSAPLSAHVAGMTVYNTATANDVVPGFYYNDGIKWQQMVTTDNKAVKFFYMPSITFNTSVSATGQTKNLYQEYKAQFALTNPNHIVSPGAPITGIPYFDDPTDLYYIITDYDANVFSNITINNLGVMTYDVTAAATDCTLINIVFVVK